MIILKSVLSTMIVLSTVLSLQSGVIKVSNEQQNDSDYYQDVVYIKQWNSVTDEQRYYFDVEVKAAAVGLSVKDYKFFRDVVECESVGGDNIEDRILVACTIINRVNDGRFGKSLFEILTRPGQFHCVTQDEETEEYIVAGSGSLESEWAIIEAYRRVADGTVPTDMLYFNSIGFDKHKFDYAYVGGNYYSTETPNEFTELTVTEED